MTDRVDSLAVEDILQDWKQYPDIVLDICRDLLDARSDVRRLQAVVDAAEAGFVAGYAVRAVEIDEVWGR